MDRFECIICKYTTSRSQDINRHQESQKHVKCTYKYFLKNPVTNVIIDHMVTNQVQNTRQEFIDVTDHKQFDCVCGKTFSHQSGLSRHKKTCENKNYVDEVKKLKKQLAELISKQTNVDVDGNKTTVGDVNGNQTTVGDVTNNCDEIINNCNQITNNCDEITNNETINSNNTKTINSNNKKTINNVNIITYLNNTQTDAQPLKMLENTDIKRLYTYAELGKHSLEDTIVFQHSKYVLHEFLGDIILKEFKKDDHKNQQIWISDVPRLKFIIRCAMNQDESIWHPDKKGVALTQKIIIPILNDVHLLMKNYVEVCKLNLNVVEFNYEREKIGMQSQSAIGVMFDISQKKLQHKILLYLAPYFQLEITE